MWVNRKEYEKLVADKNEMVDKCYDARVKIRELETMLADKDKQSENFVNQDFLPPCKGCELIEPTVINTCYIGRKVEPYITCENMEKCIYLSNRL